MNTIDRANVVYVGLGSGQILSCLFDPETGALRVEHELSAGPMPSFLAMDPDGAAPVCGQRGQWSRC